MGVFYKAEFFRRQPTRPATSITRRRPRPLRRSVKPARIGWMGRGCVV